jgi:hypothetical protein
MSMEFSPEKLHDAQSIVDALSLLGWMRVEFDGKCILLSLRGMENDNGVYAADRATVLARITVSSI